METPSTNDTQAAVGLVSTALLGTIFLHVSAGVRYWEDATVNGAEDESGTLIPFRNGERWCPVIDLDNGIVVGWPDGMTARIHYKVCDDGDYWLADAQGNRTHKYKGYYVPDSFLCHGDRGYGDYIIFNVRPDGRIDGYRKPSIDTEAWVPLPNAQDETRSANAKAGASGGQTHENP